MKLKRTIIEIVKVICGTAIMAMGTGLFLIPNKLSTGGFTGIATVIYYLFNIPVGTMMLILNVPLFIFACIKLGKKFLIKAIIGTASLSFFIDIFERIEPFTNDKILASLYGGILVGIGSAIILKANASTGGSDLISQIIKKFKPDAHSSTIIIIVDALVITLNVVVFGQIEIALYSAISIFIMGKAIDILLEGIYFTKMIYIISDKYDKISEKIIEEVQRGTTGIYAKGMFTNKEKMLLLCVVRKK